MEHYGIVAIIVAFIGIIYLMIKHHDDMYAAIFGSVFATILGAIWPLTLTWLFFFGMVKAIIHLKRIK